MATRTTVKKVPYNPAAYVPGGSSAKVAKAIQTAGYKDPGLKPVMIPKYTTTVVKPTSTAQGSTVIETADQIEARVRRMAEEAFNRERDAVREEAARLKLEAEGRRRAMASAYEAAAQATSGLGAGVQSGWEQAAKTLQGLAGQTTGGIADALAADLATQEQALARVGAAGTGFDARSQAAVEGYRGGFLPAEYMTRLGATSAQQLANAAASLISRGSQEGLAEEGQTRAKIEADQLSQIRELTAGRTKYESDLREQLLVAQASQVKAIQDEREFNATMALKKVAIEQAQQKINLQYAEAKAKAVTTAQKFALDQWYKEQNVILSQARNDIAQQRANTYDTNSTIKTTTTKPPSPSTVSNTVARATRVGQDAVQRAFDNIWAKTPGAQQPTDWNEDDKGPYANSPEHAAAVQWNAEQRKKSFGTIMLRVIDAISPHLKALKYTQAQIKREAYKIVSARVDAPDWWLKSNPGFVPASEAVTTRA